MSLKSCFCFGGTQSYETYSYNSAETTLLRDVFKKL